MFCENDTIITIVLFAGINLVKATAICVQVTARLTENFGYVTSALAILKKCSSLK